jgi:signal transduction histidine kinase
MQRLVAACERIRCDIYWNQDYADIAMAMVLTALALFTLEHDHGRLDFISGPLLMLQTLPVAVRRRSPMKILVVTGAAITVFSLLGYPESNGNLGVLVAFYTVAANEPRSRATIAAAVTAGAILVSFAAYAIVDSAVGLTVSMTGAYLAYGVAWLVGDNLRVRRAYTRELEERASRLEVEREEKAALAVSEERARIAREMHDVVAHYVSVTVVQAAGARRVLDKDPAAARAALEAVETAGRTALTEMRRMLEVLRTDDPGLGPQPGMGALDRLVARVRDAGLPVQVTIEGEVVGLPAGMDLAAYRIVQEALTNAVKHAGRATARVTIRYGPDDLEIDVVDDGRGAAAPLIAADQGGHGLIGMKERVALFGGQPEAGPVFPGGYRVLARLPIEREEPLGRARVNYRGDASTPENMPVAARPAQAAQAKPRGETLVKPRVVPPMIGRVVPPHLSPWRDPSTRLDPSPRRHDRGVEQ